jgi:hypothetical protein
MAKGVKTGGRKKGTPNKATAEIRGLAREYTAEALEALVGVMRDSDQPSARVSAAREILDRGYGKPSQAHTGEDGGAMELVTRIERVFVNDTASD